MQTNKKNILNYIFPLLVLGSFIVISPVCLADADNLIAPKTITSLNFENIFIKILAIIALAGIMCYCICYLVYVNKNEAKIAKIDKIIDVSEALFW